MNDKFKYQKSHVKSKDFTVQAKVKSNLGFTLIELLVVIAIIGVLSTLLLANFNSARSRARDAKRKSDVNQIIKALELYKNDTNAPLEYPASITWGSALSGSGGTYMTKVPCDPLDGCSGATGYLYQRDPATVGDNLTHQLVVCLENAADIALDSSNNAHCGTTRHSYTRTQP